MSALQLTGINKKYDNQVVVSNLDFSVVAGELVSLLGPSGCGKTTLLRIISGLADADGGHVFVDGEDLTNVRPHQRNIGVVFQNYALFPHLTVGENIAFGPKARGDSRSSINTIVSDMLKRVKLDGYADRSIGALSGGQQQRVAVARAIATRPRLLLLDEPLSALDRKLRESMQVELRQLLRDEDMTAVFVTHDQDEALAMSDKIAVMNNGQIEQFDSPQTLYNSPQSHFALTFVGLSSRWKAEIKSLHDSNQVKVITQCGNIFNAKCNSGVRVGDSVIVAVRPEKIMINDPAETNNCNRISLKLKQTVFRGASRIIHFASQQGSHYPVIAEASSHSPTYIKDGDPAILTWRVDDTIVFPLSSAGGVG